MKDELESSRGAQNKKLTLCKDIDPKSIDQLGKQVGCLCYKWVDKKLKVLIVTSKTTKS